MKVAFFTEAGFTGKTLRNNPNMRTEYAWYVALDSDHYNIHSGEITGEYDLGIVIIPKKNPQFDSTRLRKHCKKLASMQEGPHWYFQDYPLEKQIWYYNTLQEMDYLFVHNKEDATYFNGLTGKKCIVMRSLMIEDLIKDLPQVDRYGVMIGGNFCHWYGGFDSYIVAQEFEEDIYVPSMGRKIDGEENMPNLNHLPYMHWTDWIKTLNNFKYGVHLMRTHAAGTFALNCAYLGIPCIGYKGLDTQENCHIFTTVDVGDIPEAKKIAKKLKEDKDFYKSCSEIAKGRYKNYYSEENFNSKWKSICKNL